METGLRRICTTRWGPAGERLSASALDNEDIGLYLWFKAEVIEALLAFKGSALEWYTSDTGSGQMLA